PTSESASASAAYLEFPHQLVEEELDVEFERYVKTRTRLANFPFRKTLERFGFDAQPSVDRRAIMDLLSMSFVERATNVVGAWGDMFDDHDITAAILDRLLHHSVTNNIRDDSYRLKEKMKDVVL